ncbi:peptide deformylase [Helicobacter jaachi]|uniref:Peptide deformylase n=1 Tax=Helicobacter jaachi TaxID=1677920 RepID=A0A4U8TBY3_9HELI|nr:peptide deformylase [Helicobacter jaachi]TLD97431.1 peptide deformylase [Helicobacter jaachi]
MAVLTILKYPNAKLREKSTPVEEFDWHLHQFLDDMYETMMQSGGVGLAAIQVGEPKQVLIINIPREEDNTQHKADLLEIINPTFLSQEDSIEWDEGCLSVPDFYESIKRFDKVSIAYKDRYGNDKILKAQGFLSVAIQHEIDHLNGILFVDKLPILRRKKFEKELKKLKKES